jgi:hypothetical protein
MCDRDCKFKQQRKVQTMNGNMGTTGFGQKLVQPGNTRELEAEMNRVYAEAKQAHVQEGTQPPMPQVDRYSGMTNIPVQAPLTPTGAKQVQSGMNTGAADRVLAATGDVGAILAQRGQRYGSFTDNSRVAQQLKDALHMGVRYGGLTLDKREALDQIASKLSRIVTANASEYKDSWTDIAGYAKLVADTLED